MINEIFSKKYFFYFLPFLVVLINFIFYNKFYQPTEGWWQTFGYLINEGLIPYKDFSSAIVPFFMYINAFLLNIFGDKLIIFRIFGIFTILMTMLLLQWLLSKLTNKTSATIAVFVAFALNMSTPVYLAYDYSSYVDILLVLALISYYNILKSEKIYLVISSSLLIGIFLASLFLMKQNIGTFFGLSIIISILIYCRFKFLSLISLILTFTLVIIKFSTLIDMQSATSEILLNNDAKGSIYTILFRFISDSKNLKILILSILLTFIVLLLQKYKHLIETNSYWNKYKSNKKIHVFIIFIMSCIYLVLFLHIEPFYSDFLTVIIIITISTFLFIIYNVIIKNFVNINDKYIPFIIPIVALAYCTTHTAGYNFIGMYFVVAFSLAYIIYELKDFKFKEYLYLALIVLMISIMISKIFVPYNWWGLKQGNIFEAKYETNYKQLEGIKVDKKTKDLFDTVKYNIDKYSVLNDDLYVYPHIPIFYFLHNKKPPVKSIIQWFDFATTFQLKRDLIVLEKKLPKIIVMLKAPEFVYKGHYNLLKHRLIQKDYDNFFNNLILTGKYRIEHISSFIDKESKSQFNKIDKDVIITKNGLSTENIVDFISLPTSSYEIVNLRKKGYAENFNQNMNINLNFDTNVNFKIGDVITIKMNEDIVCDVVQKIGYFYGEEDDYMLTILVKND